MESNRKIKLNSDFKKLNSEEMKNASLSNSIQGQANDGAVICPNGQKIMCPTGSKQTGAYVATVSGTQIVVGVKCDTSGIETAHLCPGFVIPSEPTQPEEPDPAPEPEGPTPSGTLPPRIEACLGKKIGDYCCWFDKNGILNEGKCYPDVWNHPTGVAPLYCGEFNPMNESKGLDVNK